MKPVLPPSFADMMLGKLAKWLRLIGADVAYERVIEDDDLVHRAETENRLIITRDTRLADRADVPVFFISHDRIEDQLRQVADAYDLKAFTLFSRCLRCNVEVRRVDRESVRDRLWPYVYATQEIITECPVCGRLYWAATHRERSLVDLRKMLGGSLGGEA